MAHSRVLSYLQITSMLAAANACLAQTTISSANKWGWGEDIGWTNWADAADPFPTNNVGAALVPLSAPTCMKGYVWGENVGWIYLGGGPAVGANYSNTSGDFGVNVSTAALTLGYLSGYAWGENIGWVNFSGGALVTPPQPARYDSSGSPHRFRGYVWGENVSWISLDGADFFVESLCPSDFNGDGFVSGEDFDDFLAAFEAGAPAADFDGDGFVSGDDFDRYVAAFEGGC